MQPLLKYLQLTKVADELQSDGSVMHVIYGTATAQKPDKDGEVALFDGMVEQYKIWSKEAIDSTSAAGQELSLGNLRLMHTISLGPGGKVVGIDYDTPNKRILVKSTPKDEIVWSDVLRGIYRGYSQAGSYLIRVCGNCNTDIAAPKTFCPTCKRDRFGEINYVASVAELSLVDNPCLKEAVFQYVKVDGSTELKKFVKPSILPQPAKFSHGTVQIDIEPTSTVGVVMKSLRDSVKYEHLAHEAGGREESSHVTVRYGIIPGADTAAIQDFISKQPPLTIQFGPVDSFEPSDASNGSSPLFVSVISNDELSQINGGLKTAASDAWKEADFEYHPHATLAYVQTANVGDYKGNLLLSGLTYEVKEMSIRPAEGEPVKVKLSGTKKQAAAKQEVSVKTKPAVQKAEAKTKRKAGEDLTADAFLLVGDKDDPETWSLPWKFSTEEKTVRHLRAALARFNQVEGFSAEQKAAAWKKLLRLCKKYDIDVSDEKQPEKAASVYEGMVAKVANKLGMQKGMYEVSWLARVIEDLAYLRMNARYEEEYEQDGSTLPEDLQEDLEGIIETFLSMAAEETAELAAA